LETLWGAALKKKTASKKKSAKTILIKKKTSKKSIPIKKKKATSKKALAEMVVAGRREKFHKLDCQWASYLKGNNRREFESPMEARANGLIPCRDCFGYTA